MRQLLPNRLATFATRLTQIPHCHRAHVDEQQPAPQTPPRVNPPSASASEPPIVHRPGRLGKSQPEQRYEGSLSGSEFAQWIEDTLGSESYGAPRVFDLFTMLAITLAFALLFAFMKLIEPLLQASLPQVALVVSLFLTFTAMAQAVLWGGKKPRLASIAAGPVVWLLTFLFVGMQAPGAFLTLTSVVGNVCLSVLGFPVGYLAGGMVAGVFLLADVFRKRFLSGNADELPVNDDAIFKSDD